MTDFAKHIAALEAELKLPERLRERKVKFIRRDLCKAKGHAILEHLKDESDRLTRPHTARRRAA